MATICYLRFTDTLEALYRLQIARGETERAEITKRLYEAERARKEARNGPR